MNTTFLKLHWVPLAIAALCIAAALGGDATQELLRYDRDAIFHGEIWRLLTGNFMHLGWTHLLLNTIGLLMVWLFFGAIFSPLQWTLIVGVCSIGTGLGLLILNPNVGWYVGLSGALHGLFIAGCMRELRLKRKEAWMLLGLIMLKIVYEQIKGPMPGSASMAGGEVIVEAHLYGAITGILAVFLKLSRRSSVVGLLSDN